MSGVVQQLETDRSEASRRARRLQEELKATGREREEGAKKMAELSSQLAQAKKQRRKDITTLQEKLTKVVIITSSCVRTIINTYCGCGQARISSCRNLEFQHSLSCKYIHVPSMTLVPLHTVGCTCV